MVWVLWAAAVAVAEPSLSEAQAAAAKTAAGPTGSDVSRTLRARLAHWAPTLRAQAGFREDQKRLAGELRLAPIREDTSSAGAQWSVILGWDFSQVIFAREETQLALAQLQLARARREAMEKVARLYVERQRLPGNPENALERLRLTAELDALTGGLFREVLERAQAEMEGKR